MDINELWLLYATAFMSIATLMIVAISTIITNHRHQAGVQKIYDLFGYLYKASEERIGKANNMVEQCTHAIERAAIASEHCAAASNSLISLSKDILVEKQEQDRAFQAIVAQNGALHQAATAPKTTYETHNH